MDEAELQRLRELVDLLEAERAIAHVMYRYIEACDVLKNASYIASLFTEDAIWEGKGNLAEFGQTIGRTAIREMFVENPRMLPFTAHFLCNPTIVVAPDVSRGWGKWHVLEAAIAILWTKVPPEGHAALRIALTMSGLAVEMM